MNVWRPLSPGWQERVRTFARHSESVVAISWLPSGEGFVSAGIDKALYLWGDGGRVVEAWHGTRVADMAVHHHGSHIIAASERGLTLCQISPEAASRPRGALRGAYALLAADGEAYNTHASARGRDPPDTHHAFPTDLYVEESVPVTALTLSRDSHYALVSTASHEVHLWDLRARALVQRYEGHKQGRLVLRTCFGGADESFVISGSEDSQVFVWHRHSAALVTALPGHSGAVNAVAWNPAACMFASASDDHTVRLWAPP